MAQKNNSNVKVREVSKVAPFIKLTPFTLSLTYFDTYWTTYPPVDLLFFYEITDLSFDLFNSLILPKLKHSLSLTLLHYLPLAGHLMWTSDAAKPAVYYFPEDAVSFTVAESDAIFNLLYETVEFHPLVPKLSISDDKAEVIAIQITLFPNQGFSICISVHHSVFDGKSTMLFMKSWAYLCKQLELGQEQNPSLLPELIPCLDRNLIKGPNGIDMVYIKHLITASTGSDYDYKTRSSLKIMMPLRSDTNLVRRTFKLSHEDIKKKLRDRVLSVLDKKVEENELHLSTFVLTCAHVFVCLVKAKREDPNTTGTIWITADCRSRLDPPLPINYFGNCVTMEFLVIKASDLLEENGIAFVAEKMSDLIKGLKPESVQGSEEKLMKELEVVKEKGLDLMMSVAGTHRFDFYKSDFGWGKPKKVEIVSIDSTGAVSLGETRDGDGVEIGVVLEKQQMEDFASLFVIS